MNPIKKWWLIRKLLYKQKRVKTALERVLIGAKIRRIKRGVYESD